MPIRLEVSIEIPRGSFEKRNGFGELDFVSPLPCPFNYGSVTSYIGCDDDLLDAVVLGPTLPAGRRLTLPVRGAVGLVDRDRYDDKLVFAEDPLTPMQQWAVVAFFHCYAQAKALLNLTRGQGGRHACTGWDSATAALRRARPVPPGWTGPAHL